MSEWANVLKQPVRTFRTKERKKIGEKEETAKQRGKATTPHMTVRKKNPDFSFVRTMWNKQKELNEK